MRLVDHPAARRHTDEDARETSRASNDETDEQPPRVDRRRLTRVAARGIVIVRIPHRALHARSINVSATTLEIQCHAGFALLGLDHVHVELEMQLDDLPSWFFVDGVVVQVRAGTHTIVIAMESLAEPLAELLERTLPSGWANNSDHTHAHPCEVLIVDSELDRRMHVAAAFRAEGCHVNVASTPHGAIALLSDTAHEAEIIVVAGPDGDAVAEDLRAFLDATYAQARVVSVGEPEWTPSRPRIDDSNIEDLLRARIRSLLDERSA